MPHGAPPIDTAHLFAELDVHLVDLLDTLTAEEGKRSTNHVLTAGRLPGATVRPTGFHGGARTECRGPAARRELVDQPLGMCGHTQQDVFEVGERRDVDQLTALDQRIVQRRTASALEAASE
jgi:hypothetical protein